MPGGSGVSGGFALPARRRRYTVRVAGTSIHPGDVDEQVGLKLEQGKGPVEVFVIDHAEKPTEN